MARYNRFSKRAPLRSTYLPQQYMPNFDFLAQALATQQGQYDEVQQASQRLPQHIQADQTDVLAYKALQERRMQEVASAYKEKGLQGGNMARTKLMTDIKNDFAPTGKAYGFEANYRAVGAYQEALKEQLKEGKITKDVYDKVIERSLTEFKSYGEDGTYNQFSGYNPSAYVDVQKKIDDLAKGFETDALNGNAIGPGGRKVGKTMNGQYFYMDTDKQEFIRDEDIRAFVRSTAYADSEISGYLRQEDDLFGTVAVGGQRPKLGPGGKPMKDEDGKVIMEQYTEEIPVSEYKLRNVENALANKYGFMKQTTETKLQQDWLYKMNEQHKRDKKLQEKDDYVHRAALLIEQDGLPKIENSMWKKTDAVKAVDARLSELSLMSGGRNAYDPNSETNKERRKLIEEKNRLLALPDNEDQAAQEFEKWLQTQEGKEQYPGMYDNFIKPELGKITTEGTFETPAQRLTRAQNRWNAVNEDINKRVLRGSVIEGDKRDAMNQTLIGDSSYGGDLQNKVVRPYDRDTHRISEATDLATILDNLGINENEWKELKKNFTVSEEFNPDSPGMPGGILVTGFLPNEDGKNMPINLIIDNDVEGSNYYDRYSGFYRNNIEPLKDHGYGTGFGEPTIITAPDGNKAVIISKIEPKFSDREYVDGQDEYLGLDKQIYYYDPETGKKTPSNLTYDQVNQYIENSNPYKKY